MSTEYKRAKNKAWKAFSVYIRMRDCLETTGNREYGICVTCGKTYPFKELQAGHCVEGRGSAILFDETATHAQCRGCNIFGGGRQGDYALYMIDRYGREEYERLKNKRYETKKFTTQDLLDIAEYYKNKIKELE